MPTDLDREAWEPPSRELETVQPLAAVVELERRHRHLTWSLSALYIGFYLLLWVLAAYAPQLMRTPVAGPYTLGLALVLVQFPMAALAVWTYSHQAARRIDPLAQQLRTELRRTAGPDQEDQL